MNRSILRKSQLYPGRQNMFRNFVPFFSTCRSYVKSEARIRSVLRFCFVLFVLAILNRSVFAELKVETKPRWGFDGTIELEDFNLLTVEVFNDSEKPWQGSVWLAPVVGLHAVDVPIIQPDLFIEPYGTRQLQFYVFIPDRTEYKLSWGILIEKTGRLIAANDYKIDSLKVGDRKELIVQLTNSDTRIRKSKLPTFNEELFPSSATVLTSVSGLALDHVPRWQNPQVQAFRDWLFGGGTLYLPSPNADDPLEFPASLSELNEPSDEFPVGYGKVIRTSEPITMKIPDQTIQQNYKSLSPSNTIFTSLKLITTPEHNWGLIYFMAVVYLLILFPGCWLLGRKKGDYRVTYTIVLGTVALFSFGFHTIGKRGYGEETTVNSVAIVKPGQPGRWLVKQWSNLFITSGGDYLVKHDVDASSMSTGQHIEAVRGLAINQPAAVMQTDIPSFSNRTTIHTGILKASGFLPTATVIEKSNGLLENFELTLPDGVTWPTMESKIAIYRDRLYELNIHEGKLRTSGGRNQPRELNLDALRINSYRWRTEQQKTAVELFGKTLWLMVANDLGLFHGENINLATLPEDVVRVYLFTEMDENFFAKGENFPKQVGKVLYAFDFLTTPDE